MKLCSTCPKKEKIRVPGIGDKRKPLWLIGLAPGSNEVREKEPFVGLSGQIVNQLLNLFGYSRDDVYIDNVCQCFCQPGKPLPKQPAQHCVKHLWSLFKKYQPEVVVLFGEETKEYVLFDYTSIYEIHGVPIHKKFGDKKITFIPTFHPAKILYESQLKNAYFNLIQTDFKLACKLSSNPLIDETVDPSTFIIPDSLEEISSLFNALYTSSEPVAFDFETTSLRPYDGEFISMAFSNGNITFAFDYKRFAPDVDNLLKKFFTSGVTKVAHNLKFEAQWVFHKFNVIISDYFDDTMLLAYYIRPQPKSLKKLAQSYLKVDEWEIDRKKLSDYSMEEILKYNAYDAVYTYKLYKILRPWFNKTYPANSSFRYTYENWARQVPVYVAKAQVDGIVVDLKVLDELEKHYKQLLRKELEIIYSYPFAKESLSTCQDLFDLVPGEDIYDKLVYVFTLPKKHHNKKLVSKIKSKIFSFASTVQLANVLREYFKYDLPLTDKGNYSVSDQVLRAYSDKNEFVAAILRVRGILKNLSTYIVNIRDLLDESNKLHTEYNQLGTTTSRFSSSNPNFQNWPKRKGKELRNIFCAPPGKLIVRFDAKALEVTVLQMYAKDKVLGHYLKSGGDMHYDTALKLYKDPELARQNRSKVKNGMVFPVFYGAGFNTVREAFPDLSEKQVRAVYDYLREQFAGVVEWQQKTWKFYTNFGFVPALHGYRRWLPMTFNSVINAPIQGFAAFLLWSAWVDLLKKGYWSPLYVHDEINLIIDDNEESLRKAIKDIYQVTVKRPFKILQEWPIDIDVEIGYSWGNLTKINYRDYL